MRRLIVSLMGAAALLVSATAVRSQDLLVPAGTLLQCTMEEPNFSSATASVGDPVLCHLKSFQEFGRRPCFHAGSMLAGHLEADKDPGHFVGKGYLKITFDRVIVPSGDVPLPAKVIASQGLQSGQGGGHQGQRARETRRGGMAVSAPVALEGGHPPSARSAANDQG